MALLYDCPVGVVIRSMAKTLKKTGVEPDMYVGMNFEDRINKRDPQLDKAIEEILKQLK